MPYLLTCSYLSSRYVEIELGPHGHHIVLLLDGERNAVAKLLPIQYDAVIGEKSLLLIIDFKKLQLFRAFVVQTDPFYEFLLDTCVYKQCHF